MNDSPHRTGLRYLSGLHSQSCQSSLYGDKSESECLVADPYESRSPKATSVTLLRAYPRLTYFGIRQRTNLPLEQLNFVVRQNTPIKVI